MESAALSTGISVQWPSPGGTQGPGAEQASTVPFPYSPCSQEAQEAAVEAKEWQEEQEAYSACHELAYRFACEKTRAAVQTVLHKANHNCYDQVLRFFERFRAGEAAAAVASSPSAGARRFDPSAPVCFPGFHAVPTAAVIAGADATASELWVEPLTLTLQRAFPLCLVVPRDVPTARKLVEWLCARLETLRDAQRREEQWLKDELDGFDLLPLHQPPVASSTDRMRLVTRSQATRQSRLDGTPKLLQEQQRQMERLDAYGERASDAYAAQQDAHGSESEPEASEAPHKRKRRRQTHGKREKSVTYARWTMTTLLATIQQTSAALLRASSGQACVELLDALQDVVLSQLDCALAAVSEQHGQQGDQAVAQRLVACYEATVAWLRRRLASCRAVAAPLVHALRGSTRGHVHVGPTELQLAQVLHHVLAKYMAFLDAYVGSHAPEDAALRATQRRVRAALRLHQDRYELRRADDAQPLASRGSTSFLLLCVEQLEAFPAPVLSDFVALWTHWTRQRDAAVDAGACCSLGLVAGVATAASPALRRLDVALAARLELQFFSLADAQQCVADVLEALVVDAQLPVTLAGHVLRALAARLRRLPSVPRLLLALRLLLFSHLRHGRWRFLALATCDVSACDAAHVARLPPTRWRDAHSAPARETSRSWAWLAPLSGRQREDVAACVAPERCERQRWRLRLDGALEAAQRRRRRWTRGWRCFRAACAWLDVAIRRPDARGDGQDVVTLLAWALDGDLSRAASVQTLLQTLRSAPRERLWTLLGHVLDDWQAACRAAALDEPLGERLRELRLLCEYVARHKPSAEMETALRQEISDVLTDELLAPLLRAQDEAWTPVDALVARWTRLQDASALDERLRVDVHGELRAQLLSAAVDEHGAHALAHAAWAKDVGLALLFYEESASARLSLREWFESFSAEVEQDEAEARKSDKRARRASATARKARFLRAYCTLRHWGFLKSDAPRDGEQDSVEKLVFI